jgi:hypothetical protein
MAVMCLAPREDEGDRQANQDSEALQKSPRTRSAGVCYGTPDIHAWPGETDQLKVVVV